MLLLKYKISGHSMEPVINDGQQVIVSDIPYLLKRPQVNDIIAVKYKEDILIKRITRINRDEVFIQGDNSKDSLDSRKLGFINLDKVIGKVIYKI